MDTGIFLNKYKYRTELHAHSSPVSVCGRLTAEEVVKKYIENTAADTLTLTNHLNFCIKKERTRSEITEFFLSDYYKAVEAARGTGLNVALGAEICFIGTANDYLIYGISPDDIEKLVYYMDTDIATLYREFKNDKNIIIQAHPFRDRMEPTPFGFVDGIEVFNTHYKHNSRISQAAAFAKEHNFAPIGGSDFHGDPGGEGTCLLCTKSKLRDSYDVAEAIKENDFLLDILGNILIPHL